MLNALLTSLVLSSLVLTSPTELKPKDLYSLFLFHSTISDFCDETSAQFSIDAESVGAVLISQYALQIKYNKAKSKKAHLKALCDAISWCRYWRDNCTRLEQCPENVAKFGRPEYFFRILQRR